MIRRNSIQENSQNFKSSEMTPLNIENSIKNQEIFPNDLLNNNNNNIQQITK